MHRLLALCVAVLVLLGGVTLAEARTINGTAGNNRLIGSNRSDVIRGGLGDDRIDGRGGADIIAGGGGRDVLVGGRGRDTISGGNQNDVIDVRDGETDRVVCGEARGGRDRDVVYADRRDQVNADCEHVRR